MKRWLPFLGPLLVLLILLARIGGPAPNAATAPASEFSAARAYATERAILGGIGPHPIGSPANAIVRQRIVNYLTSLNYEVRVEHAFGCAPHATCAWTDNVIAHAPGTSSAPALALMAHYDSVPAGPGASDDGIGVAALLEVARAVRTQPFRNPVLFVITDGEEAGLLGAEALARDRNAPAVATVINVDNRGTSGPSLMFETSARSRRIVQRVVRAMPRPSTSSLFATIYDLIPHDTDLTVFKRSGRTGVNFAAIGDVWAYHTPHDDLARVNLRTLQAHGDNALAALRALGDSDLHDQSGQNLVWFDVLMLRVISWREDVTMLMAIVALIAAIAAAALLVREKEATFAGVLIGAVGLIGAALMAAVVATLLAKIATLHAVTPWIARPAAAIAAMWLTGIAAAIGVPSLLRTRTTPSGMLAGQALVWAALSVVLAFLLPGATYLTIVPALVLDALAFLHAFTDTPHELTAGIAATLIAIPFFSAALMIYDGLGNGALRLIAAVIALCVAVLGVVITSRVFALGAVAAAIVLSLVSLALPATTPRQRVFAPLRHVTDGASSQWITSTPTAAMRNVAPFTLLQRPWAPAPEWQSAAPPIAGIQPVRLTVERDTRAQKRTVAVRVHSPRNAPRVVLFFRSDARIESLRVNGVVPPPRPAHYYSVLANGWQRAAVFGGGDAVVEIVTSGVAPIELVASDLTYGLPAFGHALAQARDASNATTSDDGDVTTTVARARI